MLDVTITNGDKNSQEYLYELLTRIKQRPGMYLGKVSITRLKMLLMGYSMSRGELGFYCIASLTHIKMKIVLYIYRYQNKNVIC